MSPDISADQLSKILALELESSEMYAEICKLVLSNVNGNVWLIGGTVSRTLASKLYGAPIVLSDFDFVTDGSLVQPVIVPEGWSVSYSKFNNPTFTKDGVSIDLWPISSHDFVKGKNMLPTIENLFLGMPYTIQVMAYNVTTKKLIGETGITALKTRTFSVNNLKTAQSEALRKGVTIGERMSSKAKSMGFNVVLPR